MAAIATRLSSILPVDAIAEPEAHHLTGITGRGGGVGRADAVVFPSSPEEVSRVVAWCYTNDVPITPRGGGTGLAGGTIPLDGGVVLSLDRMNRIRSFDPLLWRIHVEAGVTTGAIHRIAREHGLRFPPDPGAAELSQIGGNIACNAGGPHAFKYGVTGTWVTGLEAVVPPGDVITVGGPIRKDVAGYDLKSLLTGSEGTLGIITAAWLRLIPAPELELPVVGFYPGIAEGVAAIERIFGSGIVPAAIEYLDGTTLGFAAGSFPVEVPADAGFMVIAEADGSIDEARRVQSELVETLVEDALRVYAPERPSDVAELWRWRGGVAFAIIAQKGGAIGEDIVVPLDRLAEIAEQTLALGERHDVVSLSFGHAGDGNIHVTFLHAPEDPAEAARVHAATAELYDLVVGLGGSLAGEHGVGWLKRGALEKQLDPGALALHRKLKQVFDPKGLLNPGKKV
jgi:glycolate oxidase subunit GlcD